MRGFCINGHIEFKAAEMKLTIPLLVRGRAKRASSADLKFRNPLPQPARVAVLAKQVTGKNLRVFDSPRDREIQAFQPAILAGTLDALRDVPAAPESLKTLVIFSTSPLSTPDRDWLWNKFQVPCFEQLLGSHGRVIAEECEVHCGLHVLETAPASATLTSAECDCGRLEPRLVT